MLRTNQVESKNTRYQFMYGLHSPSYLRNFQILHRQKGGVQHIHFCRVIRHVNGSGIEVVRSTLSHGFCMHRVALDQIYPRIGSGLFLGIRGSLRQLSHAFQRSQIGSSIVAQAEFCVQS